MGEIVGLKPEREGDKEVQTVKREIQVMTETPKDCGLCGIYPKWLQKRANSHTFILVYGFLGLVQAMAFIYIVVTLTTLEKRFKIPSQTTGIILSGNEISQILSLILMYYGGAGHRPRWLAAGVGFSALSCFILVIPHLIYGPGKAALALTQEYLDRSVLDNATTTPLPSLCPGTNERDQCDEEDLMDGSLLPRVLVFMSQFVLGIGTTLYFGLGQTYLDDNTKKSNTPMLLGFTFALRTTGPALGFILAFACLKFYIVPTLHPVITDKDPRWLGAWWLGWIILGCLLLIFALLIAMFPRHLPKPRKNPNKKKRQMEGEVPLKIHNRIEGFSEPPIPLQDKIHQEDQHEPSLKDFPVTLVRVLSNQILLCNNLSAVFGIFGLLPYFTFMAKYLEVQFNTSAAGGTVITGPIALIGMVLGFLGSGFFISRVKPRPTRLLSWNVFGGLVAFAIQITYVFIGCETISIQGVNSLTMEVNFTTSCNVGCSCDGVKYSPVCHEASMTSFFSACHAGCTTSIDPKHYGNCSCVPGVLDNLQSIKLNNSTPWTDTVVLGPCLGSCTKPYIFFVVLSMISHCLMSTGKIGNVLVNYRCVAQKDKSVAQGVTLMFVSLFALIPGPIVYGFIIDQSCLIWESSCGSTGNCWYYDKEKFRYFFNITGACFTFIATILDACVCYLCRNLDLYGADEDKRRAFIQEDNKIIIEAKERY